MAKVNARASKLLAAPPDRVLAFLRDYSSRPQILSSHYTAYTVEPGPDGTVLAYHFAAGGRERDYRLRVEESANGLVERDELSSFVNEWSVVAAGTGSEVTIASSWDGAGGIGGIFEGLFAPLGLRKIYGEVLGKLAGVVVA